jgi:hypothetical protein
MQDHNRSNQAVIRQSNKKGKRSWKNNLSAFTMHLESVGQVKEVNMLDPDSHADSCVVGKEALIFQYFDCEVTVSGYDPEGEKISIKTVSTALGYVIP